MSSARDDYLMNIYIECEIVRNRSRGSFKVEKELVVSLGEYNTGLRIPMGEAMDLYGDSKSRAKSVERQHL